MFLIDMVDEKKFRDIKMLFTLLPMLFEATGTNPFIR